MKNTHWIAIILVLLVINSMVQFFVIDRLEYLQESTKTIYEYHLKLLREVRKNHCPNEVRKNYCSHCKRIETEAEEKFSKYLKDKE